MNRLIITKDNTVLIDVTDTATSLMLGGVVELFAFDGDTLSAVDSPQELSNVLMGASQIVIHAGEITSKSLSFWEANKRICDGKWYVEVSSLLSNLN